LGYGYLAEKGGALPIPEEMKSFFLRGLERFLNTFPRNGYSMTLEDIRNWESGMELDVQIPDLRCGFHKKKSRGQGQD